MNYPEFPEIQEISATRLDANIILQTQHHKRYYCCFLFADGSYEVILFDEPGGGDSRICRDREVIHALFGERIMEHIL